MSVGLIVPVFYNVEGFIDLVQSIDYPIDRIYVHKNYENGNEGVARGWNEGLKRFKELDIDVAIVSNDDVVFLQGCIDRLVSRVQQGYDLVTASNTRDFPQRKDYVGGVEELDFACFAVNPARFLDKMGYFDERFWPAYFEDTDMKRRLWGESAAYARDADAQMFHSGSVTQNWGGQMTVTSQMFEANRERYIEKWGESPDEMSKR